MTRKASDLGDLEKFGAEKSWGEVGWSTSRDPVPFSNAFLNRIWWDFIFARIEVSTHYLECSDRFRQIPPGFVNFMGMQKYKCRRISDSSSQFGELEILLSMNLMTKQETNVITNQF